MPGPMEMSTMRQLTAAAQLSLGIVFLLSAVPKLRRPRAFVQTVAAYGILPRHAVPPVAGAVTLLETVLALAFLLGWWNGAALPLAAALLLGFLGAVGANMRRGRRIPCGCFGDRSETISSRTLARLLLLLAVVAFVLAIRGMTGSPAPGLATLVVHGATPIELVQTIGLAGCLLLVGCWLQSLPDIVVVHGLFRGISPSGLAGDELEGM